MERDVQYYLTKQNRYGLPLDFTAGDYQSLRFTLIKQ